MKSCRLSLPLPLCSRRHPAAGPSRREPSAGLPPVRPGTTRAARLRSCFSVAAVVLAAGVLSGLPAAPTASAQAAAVTGKIFWGPMGANGDCAAPGCTTEATVSDFSVTAQVESKAVAEGSANGGKIVCVSSCTPIITFAAKVGLTDSSMQLVAQDDTFDFVVVFPAGSGGAGSPPPATYRFGWCGATGSGYVVQGAEGTGASVQLVEQCNRVGATFSWPEPTGPETVVYPQGAALPSPPASSSASASAEAGPLRSAVASTGGGAAELSLAGTSAAADEVLTSYSISAGGNLCTAKTGTCNEPSPLTATMGFDPVSTTQFMTAGLEVSQWRTALVTPRGLGTTLAYQFEAPALVSYTATTGTGGSFVQAVFWSTGLQPPSAVTASPPNLITGGDFSQPVVSGFETFYPLAKTTLPSAVNSIQGWKVGANSVDVMGHAYWKLLPPGSPRDAQSVDLSGGAPGSISQTVSTTAGSRYLLKWYASGNHGCGQSTKVMHVRWDSKIVASPSINTGGPAAGKMVWSSESQVVVASSARSVLEFADATPDKSPCGAVVADVSLTPDTKA